MSAMKSPTELGTKPVGKLLLQYAIPAIIAMTASSLYNMVDSIFIGHGVGALAISGLAITFPLMNLSAAFGAMVGVGGGTMISVKLGQKDHITAQNILGNIITLNLILGILFGAICLAFMDPILVFFGATPDILPYAHDYMVIIMLGNVITHMYLGLNSVLRSAGHPRVAMGATIFTVVINSILDPIFIWTLGMGIQGAALATILSQALALGYQIWRFNNPNEVIHIKKGYFKLKRKIVGSVLSIGMSPFLMNLAACMVSTIVNQSLASYGGDLAIGAYGVVNRIVFIFIMVTIGINQGMQPIAGYNYGAKQYDRVIKVLKYTIFFASIVTTVSCIVGVFFPKLCAQMFTDDATMIDIICHSMPIIVVFHWMIGFQIATSNFFQSIGHAWKAIFLSLSRQLIFLLPPLLILPQWLGLDGVWWAMAGSDFAATFTTAILLYLQMKTFKKQMA